MLRHPVLLDYVEGRSVEENRSDIWRVQEKIPAISVFLNHARTDSAHMR
jgi:hypothetical protein